MDAVFGWVSEYGYGALFALLMFGILGLPVPDETLLVFCGYLIWTGRLHPVTTFAAGFAGSVCGISLSYLLGRTYGNRVIHRYGRWIRLTDERLARVHYWFGRIGAWLLAVGYFIPGVRHFTALVAGTAELKWPVFAMFAYSGAALWVGTFLSIGYAVGENWRQTSELLHEYALEALAVTAVLLLAGWLLRKRLEKSS